MKLYLIKRKSDGFFFRSSKAGYSIYTGQDKTEWSETPAMMLRTPDGVAGNLRKLCSEPFWQKDGRWKEIGWRNFDPKKLDLFEVVCMEIDILSMTATPAKHFAQLEAIQSIPLNRYERERGATL